MSLRSVLRTALPFGARLAIRRAVWLPLDLLDRSRNPLIPPRGLRFVGNGDYEAVGRSCVQRLIELGGLKPTDRVLDVGCGSGRVATSLASYLTTGTYEGFDIIKPGIDWASRNITSRFPNMRFQHADIKNTHYNPRGRYSAADWKFPYPDKSFDFVFLTSVFTHMLPENVRHYLSEIRRVLSPGGTCYATCLLLNEESNLAIAEGRSIFPLTHRLDRYSVLDINNPEIAIGFDYELMIDMLSGFSTTVHFGSWCGRDTQVTSHDILLLRY